MIGTLISHVFISEWRRQVFESGGLRIHEKPDLPEAFAVKRLLYARVWRESGGPPFPRKQMNLGLGRDAISRCLERLICTLQSLLNRYSITFSIPPLPHPHPHYFCVNLDKLRDP